MIRHVVGLSGGKDSTALAFALKERHPEIEFEYLCTPTGDELPDMLAHWEMLECRLGKKIQRVTLRRMDRAVTLTDLINEQETIPSHRMRFCTRMLKIQPTLDWIKMQKIKGDSVILYVGLRADEEERKGIYSEEVECKFPFREWGWGIKDVWVYLQKIRIKIPKRTDCARCYAQRIGEWYHLWKYYPDIFADAERQEDMIGHTFRRPGNDSFPAALRELRREFEKGRIPKSIKESQIALFDVEESDQSCRVCRLRKVSFVEGIYHPKVGTRLDTYRDLFGKLSDYEISRRSGVHRGAVRWMRQRMKIPPFVGNINP